METPALLDEALSRRTDLLHRLRKEGTDCYRLFHGIAEGRPGLAIDRYGPILLFQTWREPLAESEIAPLHRAVEAALEEKLQPVFRHRGTKVPRPSSKSGDGWDERSEFRLPAPIVGRELGLRYDVTPRRSGRDPLLFLDFRCGRRRVLGEASGKSVLNLFAYTCGVGVAAAAGGAVEVWNVDFSRSALEVGRENAGLNGLDPARFQWVKEDVLPVARGLAGLSLRRRRRERRETARFERRLFDMVVLDPPRWSKGPFGAVDVVRDYPSLFKPALLATAQGGRLLVTNNSPEVERSEWLRVLERTGEKCGRPLSNIEVLLPEADFPSFDSTPPLKVAWIEV